VWRELREELHPKGLEVVTIALDSGGIESAAPFIDAAAPTHPSLVDETHLLDELFGVVNVPSGIWIDEEGIIVRPPEPAWPGKVVLSSIYKRELPDGIDPYLRDTLIQARKIRHDPEKYAVALRDWVEQGRESRYVLTPDEVVERSRPRTQEAAEAAAHFELAQRLWNIGDREAAFPHFREARRLQPDNWTYKRQAWSFVHPFQAPTEELEGDWVSDVIELGPENYYPELQM